MSKDSQPSTLSNRRETRAKLDLTEKDIEDLSAFVNTRRWVRRTFPVSASEPPPAAPELSETLESAPEIPSANPLNLEVVNSSSSSSATFCEFLDAHIASSVKESSLEVDGHLSQGADLSYDDIFAQNLPRRSS